ncbi:transposase [Bacillus toyonensis]|uniref:transposase n=1 Tax=Bacillus toyonensis TaxID=155322 RepID=UPI00211D9F8B|nr:transposase [Bacillus toyonensis]
MEGILLWLTFQTYSDELKIQVVKSYLNGEGSQSVLAKKYKLRSRTQLMNGVQKYQETGDISDWRGKMVVITAYKTS